MGISNCRLTGTLWGWAGLGGKAGSPRVGKIYPAGTLRSGSPSAGNSNYVISSCVCMPNGKVFMANSLAGKRHYVYDPETATVANPTGATIPAGSSTGANGCVMLPDGRVYIGPGGNGTAQVYDPATNDVANLGGVYPSGTVGYKILGLSDGRVLLNTTTQSTGKSRIYNPADDSISALAVDLPCGTWVLLPDGRVFLRNIYDPVFSIYDPATDALTMLAISALNVGTKMLLLPDGRIYAYSDGLTFSYFIDPIGETVVKAQLSYSSTIKNLYNAIATPDGCILAYCGETGATKNSGLINPSTLTAHIVNPRSTHYYGISCLCYMQNGNIFVGYENGGVVETSGWAKNPWPQAAEQFGKLS